MWLGHCVKSDMTRVLHKTRSEWEHCIKLDVVGA